jgi:hypothetical protein
MIRRIAGRPGLYGIDDAPSKPAIAPVGARDALSVLWEPPAPVERSAPRPGRLIRVTFGLQGSERANAAEPAELDFD